jgi:hypothetical protein
MTAARMTEQDLVQLERTLTASLNGDHTSAVDALCRGLIRTIEEVRALRRENGILRERKNTYPFAQSA